MVPQNLFGQYAQSTKTDVGKKEPYWVSVVREANKAFLHFFPQSKPLETAIKMVLESGKVFWDEFLLIAFSSTVERSESHQEFSQNTDQFSTSFLFVE